MVLELLKKSQKEYKAPNVTEKKEKIENILKTNVAESKPRGRPRKAKDG